MINIIHTLSDKAFKYTVRNRLLTCLHGGSLGTTYTDPFIQIRFPLNQICFPFIQIRFPFIQIRFPFIQIRFPLNQICFPFIQICFPFIQIRFPFIQIRFLFIQIRFPFIQIRFPFCLHIFFNVIFPYTHNSFSALLSLLSCNLKISP